MKMLQRTALQNKEYDLRCQKHFLFAVLILLTNFSLYNTNNNHHLSVQISKISAPHIYFIMFKFSSTIIELRL